MKGTWAAANGRGRRQPVFHARAPSETFQRRAARRPRAELPEVAFSDRGLRGFLREVVEAPPDRGVHGSGHDNRVLQRRSTASHAPASPSQNLRGHPSDLPGDRHGYPVGAGRTIPSAPVNTHGHVSCSVPRWIRQGYARREGGTGWLIRGLRRDVFGIRVLPTCPLARPRPITNRSPWPVLQARSDLPPGHTGANCENLVAPEARRWHPWCPSCAAADPLSAVARRRCPRRHGLRGQETDSVVTVSPESSAVRCVAPARICFFSVAGVAARLLRTVVEAANRGTNRSHALVLCLRLGRAPGSVFSISFRPIATPPQASPSRAAPPTHARCRRWRRRRPRTEESFLQRQPSMAAIFLSHRRSNL